MSARLDFTTIDPVAMQLLFDQETLLSQAFERETALGSGVLELIKLYVSQRNGCAYCVDMHTRMLQQQGEDTLRISGVLQWQSLPYFSAQEQAVLRWVSAIGELTGPSDAEYDEAVSQLGEHAVFYICLAVNAISAWNRVAKAFTPPVGVVPR